MNGKDPRVTPALCDAAKQYTQSRQRAQASGAADVLLMSPAGSGGDGGRRSREGRSGGGTGTEAGIAMGGVRVVVVEYQSIDIIEQRRPHARPS